MKEFRRACAVLGVAATVPEIDAAFKLLDDDGSGSLAYEEINKHLRVGSSGRKASGGASSRLGVEESLPKPITLNETKLARSDAHLAKTQATRIRATTSAADLFHRSHATWEEEERQLLSSNAQATTRHEPSRDQTRMEAGAHLLCARAPHCCGHRPQGVREHAGA